MFLINKLNIENSDLSLDNSTKFLVGKRHVDLSGISSADIPTITTAKKHINYDVDVYFDRNTGYAPSYLSATYILGNKYEDLPTIAKEYPYVFNGWHTEISNGIAISNDTLVELDYDTLYALWNYVDIKDDYTSFKVQATNEYNKIIFSYLYSNDNSKPICIDWGDNTVEQHYGNISALIHEYESPGTYIAKINNNLSGIYLSTTYDSDSKYTIIEIGKLGSIFKNQTDYMHILLGYTNISAINDLSDCNFLSVGNAYFTDMPLLTSIQLPATCLYLGTNDSYPGAFSNCSSLISVDASYIKTIGYAAFTRCVNLEKVILSNVTTIGLAAFLYTGLSTISLPSCLTSIAYQAFSHMDNLISIELPDSVENLKYNFDYCSNLTYAKIGKNISNLSCFGSTSLKLSCIEFNSMVAPMLGNSTFGTTSATYVGYNSRGHNILRIHKGAIGYDQGRWLSVLLDPDKCGFNIEYIDDNNEV